MNSYKIYLKLYICVLSKYVFLYLISFYEGLQWKTSKKTTLFSLKCVEVVFFAVVAAGIDEIIQKSLLFQPYHWEHNQVVLFSF